MCLCFSPPPPKLLMFLLRTLLIAFIVELTEQQLLYMLHALVQYYAVITAAYGLGLTIIET